MRRERGERRRRRDRNSGELPIANAVATLRRAALLRPPQRHARRRPACRRSLRCSSPVAAPCDRDTPTAPAKIPFEPLPPPPVPAPPIVAEPAAEVAVARTKSVSTMPPMDELDTGWDLGDDDPTAGEARARNDEHAVVLRDGR